MRKIELRRRGEAWAVRAKELDGSGMEYVFDSKNQARFFAAVLRMGPADAAHPARPPAEHPPAGRSTADRL